MDHHQASDNIRRELEHRLLQYRYDLLLAVPSPFEDGFASAQTEVAQQQATQARKVAQSQKDEVRNKVERLAADIVTLLIPLELAWMIVLEWRDMKDASRSYHICAATPFLTDVFQMIGMSTISNATSICSRSKFALQPQNRCFCS
jgi:hypothetical protein